MNFPGPSETAGGVAKPLCVDLDGTLLLTDSLVEGALSLLSTFAGIHKLIWALTAPSRASLKQRIAQAADVDVANLPLNTPLVAYLREQKLNGRRIVLATAADGKIAHAIADHLGLFDEVIASDGIRNLKGPAKTAELVRRYGHKGFDYAGNDRADLAVWREADGVVLVNAPRNLAQQARAMGPVVAEIDQRKAIVPSAIRAMRPHQWVKNLLVFVPLLTSHAFTDSRGFLLALVMFASFCATASGIYIANDLLDLSDDRSHPRKRKRPLASGSLPLISGTLLAVALTIVGLALAWSIGQLPILCAYTAVTLAYSLVLKTFPLVDVFILAALYTLRIIAGGAASAHPVTLWLMAFSGFTFLSLALVKRCAEIAAAPADLATKRTRRGYRPEDLQIMQTSGIASSFASSVVLALFVNSTTAFNAYGQPEVLWGVVPLILFWQIRLWLATGRGHMHDDPIVFASRDWVSWLVIGAVVVLVAFAS